MRLYQEGLKQYYISDHIEDLYFISTEYEIIHQNTPESLIPMQLRQKDGDRMLLYDVTEGTDLDRVSENHKFVFSECKKILKCLHTLMEEVDQYMLAIEHVSLSRYCIYMMKDESIRFIYDPDKIYDVKAEADELFAWLLSRLDYKDQRGIRFAYRVYDTIRKKGISQRVIEQCLSYGEGKEKTSKAARVPETEKTTPAEVPRIRARSAPRQMKTGSKEEELREPEENQGGLAFFVSKIISGISILCSIGIVGYMLWQGMIP